VASAELKVLQMHLAVEACRWSAEVANVRRGATTLHYGRASPRCRCARAVARNTAMLGMDY
jgi:hypothetical protein